MHAEAIQEVAVRDDIGTRIRKARKERGLSLAQLGGDDLSKSFISLVESGKSRISLRALGIIAERLQLPVSHFVEEGVGGAIGGGELMLDRAEAALFNQEPQECLKILDKINVVDSQQARAALLRGEALVELGNAREAIQILQGALNVPATYEDSRMARELRYALAKALYGTDNYEEALVHLRQALSAVMEKEDDPQFRGKVIVSIGHILYVTGQVDEAIQHYARARDVLASLTDLQILASAYAGLSVAYEKKNDLANALRYSKLSLGASEARQNARHAAVELNNMAMRYKEMGDLEAAIQCARESISRSIKVGALDVEAEAHSTLALIYTEEKEYEKAESEARTALVGAAKEASLPSIHAWTVLAMLAEKKGDENTSDELYIKALRAASEIGHSSLYKEIAISYSLILKSRGDSEAALRYALEAAQANSG